MVRRLPLPFRAVHEAVVEADGRHLGDRELAERFGGRVAVLIPAYEEAEALPGVLPRVPARAGGMDTAVLVVDDGSRDATAQVAQAAGAAVARLPVNRGGGAALRAGYALMERAGAAIVVTLDADGQHRPEELERLVEPIAAGRAHVVQGSRTLGSSEPGALSRQLGIAFFNRLISLLTGARVTDCSNGYRAVRADVLPQLELRQEQFHAAEVIVEVLMMRLPFEEAPISVLRRSHGHSKKPRTLRYGFGFGRAIVSTWMRGLTRRGSSPRTGRTPLKPEPSAAERRGG
jgi:glycosyltransferase involved in cell wall biosynthesis